MKANNDKITYLPAGDDRRPASDVRALFSELADKCTKRAAEWTVGLTSSTATEGRALVVIVLLDLARDIETLLAQSEPCPGGAPAQPVPAAVRDNPNRPQ